MLAHVRAAAYDAKVVMADENCHPFCFEGTRWIVAQNGYLPGWQVLQRELLQHCKDEYLTQMLGTTDTEFVYALLLSLLEGDSDEDVQRAVEELVRLIAKAMKDLDLPGLTKLKMALVSEERIIGINWGLGHRGEVDPAGDWRELRKADAGTDDFALGMLPGADVPAAGSQLPARRGQLRLPGSAPRTRRQRPSSPPSRSARTATTGSPRSTGRSCSSRRTASASPGPSRSSSSRTPAGRGRPHSGRRARACARPR
uniref:Class II glutamine amidotransferase n=1 Tax=Janibacter limosus TaxID=53458 RepID=A0AC61U157_9MICO|nr:class II glutamine amidotransferase [Janibacter limosus]